MKLSTFALFCLTATGASAFAPTGLPTTRASTTQAFEYIPAGKIASRSIVVAVPSSKSYVYGLVIP